MERAESNGSWKWMTALEAAICFSQLEELTEAGVTQRSLFMYNMDKIKDLQLSSAQGKRHSWLPVKIPRWCFGAQNEACRKSTLPVPRTCQERNFLQTVLANSHCLSSGFLRGKSLSCICPNLRIFIYLLGVITTCFWHCTVCGLLLLVSEGDTDWLMEKRKKYWFF